MAMLVSGRVVFFCDCISLSRLQVWLFNQSPLSGVYQFTLQSTNTAGWKINIFNRRYIISHGWFSIVMLNFLSVSLFLQLPLAAMDPPTPHELNLGFSPIFRWTMSTERRFRREANSCENFYKRPWLRRAVNRIQGWCYGWSTYPPLTYPFQEIRV